MLKETDRVFTTSPEEFKFAEYETKVLSPMEFLRDFRYEAERAGDSIFLQSMHIEAGHAINSIFDSLNKASRRGIKVEVKIDGYSELICDEKLSNFPIFPEKDRHFRNWRINEKERLFSDLNKEGGRAEVINKAEVLNRLLYFANRDHRKIAFIDGIAYLGGINLSDPMFSSYDFLVKIENPDVVGGLRLAFSPYFEKTNPKGAAFRCDDENLLLYTNGSPEIYNRGLELIKNANERVIISSQFAPDRQIARLLKEKVSQGVETQVMVTSPNGNSGMSNFVERIKAGGVKRLEGAAVFEAQGIKNHMKLLVADHTALIGSHNITTSLSDKLRTKELSLLTSNENLVNALVDYFDSEKYGGLDRMF